ncbi:MAG: AsnC family transcriptional regulator [bacterium]
MNELTESDIKLLRLLQGGLPMSDRPFAELAERAGLTEEETLRRTRAWLETGVIRRVGAFIAHRRVGFSANGMAVWDVAEDRLEEAGAKMAERASVSHCYARPRSDRWPYRLYTMIHGKTRDEVEAEARNISEELGIAKFKILFSARELKKSDSKLFMEDEA